VATNRTKKTNGPALKQSIINKMSMVLAIQYFFYHRAPRYGYFTFY